METRRSPAQRLFLHAVLIGCSVLFALPFAWLVGTSWKQDKELQSADLQLFPRVPQPRGVSPYVDDAVFSWRRPETLDAARWETRRTQLQSLIDAVLKDWRPPELYTLDRAAVLPALAAGLYDRVREQIPSELWTADDDAFQAGASKLLQARFADEALERVYRYLAIGRVMLNDTQYRIHDLTAGAKPDALWNVAQGDAMPRAVALDQPGVIVSYGFAGADRFELVATLPLPVPREQFKRLDISLHGDESWHAVEGAIEFGGVRYEAAAPVHIGADGWSEIAYQLPGPDDQRMIPRRYTLLRETGRGSQFDPGADSLRLRITVTESGLLSACWAKATANYRRVFAEVPFWRYLASSVFLAIVNIVGTAASCTLAAYALARLQWPGRSLCFVLVLATLMIPPQITMIPSFVVYRQLGWYNTLAPLWAPACLAVNAFAVFLLRQAMMGIPRELEDAARIDGCGTFRTFWHVALPEMKPTLAAISIFTFMYVWNDFMGPLIYVNDQRLYPLALGLFSFMAGRENQFTLIMAGAMVMTIPVILIFFFLQRYFIQGMTLSGLKG